MRFVRKGVPGKGPGVKVGGGVVWVGVGEGEGVIGVGEAVAVIVGDTVGVLDGAEVLEAVGCGVS